VEYSAVQDAATAHRDGCRDELGRAGANPVLHRADDYRLAQIAWDAWGAVRLVEAPDAAHPLPLALPDADAGKSADPEQDVPEPVALHPRSIAR